MNFDAYNAKKDIPEILDFTEEEVVLLYFKAIRKKS